MKDASWKLKMLIRPRRFYTDADLLILYKAHLLSFLEHATCDILQRVDRTQSKFLQDAGVNEGDALMHFNRAPLTMRRDIAMLNLLHWTAI